MTGEVQLDGDLHTFGPLIQRDGRVTQVGLKEGEGTGLGAFLFIPPVDRLILFGIGPSLVKHSPDHLIKQRGFAPASKIPLLQDCVNDGADPHGRRGLLRFATEVAEVELQPARQPRPQTGRRDRFQQLVLGAADLAN